MQVWRLLGEYDAETTTFSALAGSGGSSPYTPDFNGTLVGLRTIVGREALTSVVNGVEFRLTCDTFRPNAIGCQAAGAGLATATTPQPPPIEWPVNQKVQAGVPITLEGRCLGAYTQVTVSVFVWGLFSYGG